MFGGDSGSTLGPNNVTIERSNGIEPSVCCLEQSYGKQRFSGPNGAQL